MPSHPFSTPLQRPSVPAFLAALGACLWTALAAPAAQAGVTIGNNPLFLVNARSNVLVVLDNSNSMDENAAGAAVGSAAATSKSEIARGVVRLLTDKYQSRVNMGLMAYRTDSPASYQLHNSPYDVSYDPANFNAAFAGPRESLTKRFRIPNPTSSGNFIHYNVALPFYSTVNQGNGYCYSTTANAFNNGENPSTGPWDTYRCFDIKTGTNDTLPNWGNNGSENARGYSGYEGQFSFFPTDSDFAQGILDFGKQNTWHWVSTTWFANSSPGRGFLHAPLGLLDSSKASAIKAKLACNIPGAGAPCANTGIQNAGLTPIEGTLLTARDYYAGSWSNNAEGYTASCYPLPESCGKNYVILLTDGLPSTDKNGALIANPASALSSAAAAAQQLTNAKVLTYVIGFALPYGTDPTSLDQIAAAGGTNTAYNAGDPTSLQAAFDAIFDDIFRREAAYGSVAQNTTSLSAGSRIFQAKFNSTFWSGEVRSIQPQSDGSETVQWSSKDTGRIPAAASRKVFTLKPGTGGVAFKLLTDLTTTQQTALNTGSCGGSIAAGAACGQARIDWLRGDRSRDLNNGGPLRTRGDTVLGDIIGSAPVWVPESNTLFVGANDGMLHAFDASTGNELFAYLPHALMANVHTLTAASYGHGYFVDGELAVSSRASTPGGKNILVGALGRGGRALFALDVTQPASFGTSHVLWEYTDADLGLVIGRPVIVKLNNGRPAVIVGNGPNSTNDRAFLFVIDLETGALIKKIDTVAGSLASPNGLSSPRGWDSNANGTVDQIYAGDMLGNLWKFDLSDGSPANWKVALGTVAAPVPMFVAKDASGNRQPITGMPAVGVNARPGDANLGKLYVIVGTGQYLLSSDVSNKAVQSWYGLIDSGAAISGRSALRQRSYASEVTSSGKAVRTLSAATAGDMSGRAGWYLDMLPVSGAAAGERFVGEHKFLGSVVLATSILPETDPCKPGVNGYLNAVDPFSGASLAQPFFDINNDGQFNDTGDSVNPGNAMPSDGVIVGNRMITSSTSGATSGATGGSIAVNWKPRTGRIAWREIVRQP